MAWPPQPPHAHARSGSSPEGCARSYRWLAPLVASLALGGALLSPQPRFAEASRTWSAARPVPVAADSGDDVPAPPVAAQDEAAAPADEPRAAQEEAAAGDAAAEAAAADRENGSEVADAIAADAQEAAAPQKVFAAAPALSPLEAALLERVNADRAALGLRPLALDTELVQGSRQRAAAQTRLPDLSHYDQSGQPALAGLLAASGLRYRMAGENLVRLPGTDAGVAGRAEEALMNSPGHRANILRPEYDRIAIGQAVDESGRTTFAQLFRASA